MTSVLDTSAIEQVLSKIPTAKQAGAKCIEDSVVSILQLIAGTLDQPQETMQQEGDYVKWYIEIEGPVSTPVQIAVDTALKSIGYDRVYFNQYGCFDSKYTRMSITLNLLPAEEDA